jgi:hypothetical protein
MVGDACFDVDHWKPLLLCDLSQALHVDGIVYGVPSNDYRHRRRIWNWGAEACVQYFDVFVGGLVNTDPAQSFRITHVFCLAHLLF